MMNDEKKDKVERIKDKIILYTPIRLKLFYSTLYPYAIAILLNFIA